MKLNVVNHYDFKFEYEDEFNQIAKVTKQKVGSMDQNYIVSCIFESDQAIHEINRNYRHVDRPTDVISFALLDDVSFLLPDEEETELGDIFISIDTCRRQAEEYGHSFKREICFLFTHGLLHLFGYDHQSEAEEKKMFSLQKEILDEIVTK